MERRGERRRMERLGEEKDGVRGRERENKGEAGVRGREGERGI